MSTANIDSLARLLSYCESFAKERLVASKEFHPFGAFINTNAKMETLAALLSKGDDSAKALTLLHNTATEIVRQNKAIAFAVACNVTIPSRLNPPFSDGIQVHIESSEYSRTFYIPYKKLPRFWLRRFLVVFPTFEYAEPIALESKHFLFLG